jgi:hypothetical protein
MRRILTLAGLLLSATVVFGDAVPGRIELPTPPSKETPAPTAALPITLPPAPPLPSPAQLMNTDRGSSLLPRRPGMAPASTEGDLADLKRELERLRVERAVLAAQFEKPDKASPEMVGGDAAKAAQLRARVAELVARLEAKKAKERTVRATPAAPPTQPTGPTATSAAAPADDLLQEAYAKFRADDYSAALEITRRLDSAKLVGADRALAHYLSAGCLRNLGRLDEASVQYRAVVEARGDADLVQSASWHLQAIEARRSMQRELAAIRERRPSP